MKKVHIASCINTKERVSEELDYNAFIEQGATYFFEIQKIREIMGDVNDKRIIDCACGSGYGTKYINDSFPNNVIGIDIDKQSIEYCKNKYSDIPFISGDMVEISSLTNNLVDIFISNQTLEHFKEDDQYKIINNIYNKINNGGLCFIAVPNKPVHEKYFDNNNKYHLHEHDFLNFKMIIQSKKWNDIKFYSQLMPEYQLKSTIIRNRFTYAVFSHLPKFIIRLLKIILKIPKLKMDDIKFKEFVQEDIMKTKYLIAICRK